MGAYIRGEAQWKTNYKNTHVENIAVKMNRPEHRYRLTCIMIGWCLLNEDPEAKEISMWGMIGKSIPKRGNSMGEAG